MWLIIIIGIVLIWYFCFHKKKQTSSSSLTVNKSASVYSDGPVDQMVLNFTDAFLMVAGCHWADGYSHFWISPNGVTFEIREYTGDSLLMAIIQNESTLQVTQALQRYGDTENILPYIVRYYGHAEGNSWKCVYNASVSKSSADEVHRRLSYGNLDDISIEGNIIHAVKRD